MVTDCFEKLDYTEARSIQLGMYMKHPMFQRFSHDKSLKSLGLKGLSGGFGMVPNKVLYDFLCCVEPDCFQIGVENCCLCGTALCVDHFYTPYSVAKCSCCNSWYRHLHMESDSCKTEFSIWKHTASGEIRYSWSLPRADGADEIDVGSGYSVRRDLFDMLQLKTQDYLRQGSTFRRVLIFFLSWIYKELCDREQKKFWWMRLLNPTALSCARRFYNLVGGVRYPPMNQYEFNDLVADLMFVKFFCISLKNF